MESIKLYKNEAAYQSNSATLPTTHVALCEDEGTVFYGGKKKVVDYITEEEYGSAVFNVFRTRGWISEDAIRMSLVQAASITTLNNAFKSNTGITDATFLRYFTGLTSLSNSDFNGCTNLEKIVIPCNIASGVDILNGSSKMKYVEILEGVEALTNQLLRNSCDSNGCVVKFPSTITQIPGYSFSRVKSGEGVLDLRHTKINLIGQTSLQRLLWDNEIYLPSTLQTISNDAMVIVGAGLQYVEFNSETTLSIGNGCLNSSGASASDNLVINFKNDIPITIGNTFGANIKHTCSVIFHSTTLPTIGTSFFNTAAARTSIYVPDEMVEDYKGIANLANFVSRIYPLSEYNGTYKDRV